MFGTADRTPLRLAAPRDTDATVAFDPAAWRRAAISERLAGPALTAAVEVRTALQAPPVTGAELTTLLGPQWPRTVTFLRIVHDLLDDPAPPAGTADRAFRTAEGGRAQPWRRLAELVHSAGLLGYSASTDARFGRQAVTALAVAGTPMAGPMIPQGVVARLRRLAQLSTITRAAAAPLLTCPHRATTDLRDYAALLAGLSWTTLALDLREELLRSPDGARLYAALTTPWRAAIGSLHPEDPDEQDNSTASAASALGEILAPTVARRFGTSDALRCPSAALGGAGDDDHPGAGFVLAGYLAEHVVGGITYCVVPPTEPTLRWPALARTGPALFPV
jgi:hypothetical protein